METILSQIVIVFVNAGYQAGAILKQCLPFGLPVVM